MPEESTGTLDLTPQELKEKGKRIFEKASKIGSGGRVMEPEPTKSDVLSSMREGFTEAAKSGDADKAGAIRRNIKKITEELRRGS